MAAKSSLVSEAGVSLLNLRSDACGVQNPGGTLAPSGGYVIGRRHYVQGAFKRLSAPGVEGGRLKEELGPLLKLQ